MEELKVNDRVVWYSQANRNVTGKKGIVVAVVPPGVPADSLKPKDYEWEKADMGGPRKTVSYIISTRAMKVQRPLTKYLRKMTPAEAADPNFMPPDITYEQWQAMIGKNPKPADPAVKAGESSSLAGIAA